MQKIEQIIDDSFKKSLLNRNKKVNLSISFPNIGCNGGCSYCCQNQFKHRTGSIKDLDVTEKIKKYLNRFLFLNKDNCLEIENVTILGGELKVLSLENQLKLINLINELKKKYDITLLVNDTKLDSPLMRIEGITYNIHILNWKNKNLLELDKKLNESASYFLYKIIITDNDTEEEVTNFLDINKKIRDRIMPDRDFFSKKKINQLFKENSKAKNRDDILDNKHSIYICKYHRTKDYTISFENKNLVYLFYCCNSQKIDNFDTLEIIYNNENQKCPSVCKHALDKI